MAHELTINHAATIEMQDAYEWYEKQRVGLGDELIQEIEHCFGKISTNPQYYSYTGKANKYRRIKLNRFPYVIVYEFKSDKVKVISVRNNSMRPKY